MGLDREGFEEYFKDENNNNIPDGLEEGYEKAENYLTKVWNWCKSNKMIIALSLIVFGLAWYSYHLYQNPKVEIQKQVIEKVIFKDNPEDVILSKNWYCKDLDTLKIKNITQMKSEDSGKTMVAIWYGIDDKKSGEADFITLFRLKSNLKENEKAFLRHKENTKLKPTITKE